MMKKDWRVTCVDSFRLEVDKLSLASEPKGSLRRKRMLQSSLLHLDTNQDIRKEKHCESCNMLTLDNLDWSSFQT